MSYKYHTPCPTECCTNTDENSNVKSNKEKKNASGHKKKEKKDNIKNFEIN